MAESSDMKTPDQWERKVAEAERQTVSKCRRFVRNDPN